MSGLKYVKVLNIPELLMVSEYASGRNYGRVLNIPGLPICKVAAYAKITQGSEYTLI